MVPESLAYFSVRFRHGTFLATRSLSLKPVNFLAILEGPETGAILLYLLLLSSQRYLLVVLGYQNRGDLESRVYLDRAAV